MASMGRANFEGSNKELIVSKEGSAGSVSQSLCSVELPQATKFKQSERNLLNLLHGHPGLSLQSRAGSLSLEKINEDDARLRKSSQNMRNARQKVMVKRQSSGINYFLGQMKFKDLSEGSPAKKEPSPLKNAAIQSEASDESSGSEHSSSEDLDSACKAPKSGLNTNAFMHNKMMNVPLSKLTAGNISEAFTGTKNFSIDKQEVQTENDKFVKQGQTQQHNFIDIYRDEEKRFMRITVPKSTHVKITSNIVKRMELEHIVEQIESLSIVPDFGYTTQARQENSFRGWDMFLELVQNMEKHERVENYVAAKLFAQEAAQQAFQSKKRGGRRAGVMFNEGRKEEQLRKPSPWDKVRKQVTGDKQDDGNIEKELNELFEMQKAACRYLEIFQKNHERKYKNQAKLDQIEEERRKLIHSFRKSKEMPAIEEEDQVKSSEHSPVRKQATLSFKKQWVQMQKGGKGKFKMVGHLYEVGVDTPQKLAESKSKQVKIEVQDDDKSDDEVSVNSGPSCSVESFQSEEILDTPDHIKKHCPNIDNLKKSQFHTANLGLKDSQQIDEENAEEIAKDQLSLLKLLEKSYKTTTRQLLRLCIAYGLPKQDGLHYMPTYDDNGDFHENVLKDIKQLTTDKLNVGSLMRIVNQKAYSNLSENLNEVEAVKKRVPGIKKYVNHLRTSRSRSPNGQEPKTHQVASKKQQDFKINLNIMKKQPDRKMTSNQSNQGKTQNTHKFSHKEQVQTKSKKQFLQPKKHECITNLNSWRGSDDGINNDLKEISPMAISSSPNNSNQQNQQINPEIKVSQTVKHEQSKSKFIISQTDMNKNDSQSRNFAFQTKETVICTNESPPEIVSNAEIQTKTTKINTNNTKRSTFSINKINKVYRQKFPQITSVSANSNQNFFSTQGSIEQAQIKSNRIIFDDKLKDTVAKATVSASVPSRDVLPKEFVSQIAPYDKISRKMKISQHDTQILEKAMGQRRRNQYHQRLSSMQVEDNRFNTEDNEINEPRSNNTMFNESCAVISQDNFKEANIGFKSSAKPFMSPTNIIMSTDISPLISASITQNDLRFLTSQRSMNRNIQLNGNQLHLRTSPNINDHYILKNDEKAKDLLMNKMISKNINYKIMYQRQKRSMLNKSKNNLRKSINKMNCETIKQANVLSTNGDSIEQTDDSHPQGSERNKGGFMSIQEQAINGSKFISNKKSISSYRKSNQGSYLPDLNSTRIGMFPVSPRQVYVTPLGRGTKGTTSAMSSATKGSSTLNIYKTKNREMLNQNVNFSQLNTFEFK